MIQRLDATAKEKAIQSIPQTHRQVKIPLNESSCRLSLVEKIRNIFAVDVGRYTQNAIDQIVSFNEAKSIWDEAAHRRIAA